MKSIPVRWQRLKDILAEALKETSFEKRTATLRECCGDDAELLHEAEKLLAYDDTALEEFAQFAATRLRDNECNRTGERIGAYVVVRELGRGGMGAVYVAQRADGQFEKRVRIKVLKRGTDTDEVLRRFRIERQILANLEHPNITRLLDAGTTTDGLPYFVMEFIEGLPITRFVQSKNVDLRGRLKLFLKVCSAVAFAHQNQIIHRDIKPTNVLVKSDGEPKLLDFGIAKILSVDSDDITTLIAERRLTPMYAAPEHVAGKPATVAADVYSLGALLYELLTNKPPCSDFRGRSPREDLSAILIDPPLPSQIVSDSKARDELRGYLDRIVAKAIQPDPTRRYSSVAAMSEDVAHCLKERPLSVSLTPRPRHFAFPVSAAFRWSVAAVFLAAIVVVSAVFLRQSAFPWLKKWTVGNPTPKTATEGVRSIAVLPFETFGQDMNNELLRLGMADAIIGRISNLKPLVVLPTIAVSKYKGRADDPLTAGRTFGVDAVLTGTVQRSGDQIRVTVQLIHVFTGSTIWAAKFDQTFTGIFDIQDAISENVARSLAINLPIGERQLGRHYTTNPAAYDSYLMGLYFWNKRSKEGLEKAIHYLGQATDEDPNFALGYALMADCYYLQFYYGYVAGPDRIQNARAAAGRALVLDDSIAEAHVAAAMVQLHDKENEKAMASLRRALALNPNLAIAHLRYAWELCSAGDLNDAVQEMRRAQALDPLSSTGNTALGIMLAFARQYRHALECCYKAAELAPNDVAVQENLAFAYTVNGMYDQAIERYRKVGELDPDAKGDSLTSIATVLALAGRKHDADSIMPEILQLGSKGKADPFNIAVLYGASEEKDAAFVWLAQALRQGADVRTNAHDTGIIRYNPVLDPLRSDSRFTALLRQYGPSSAVDSSNGS